jgi:hypothetical protein
MPVQTFIYVLVVAMAMGLLGLANVAFIDRRRVRRWEG